LDEGLAMIDGLAFQDRGFTVAPQYTFELDCKQSPESLWDGMHFKTRQHIRRAEEKFSVRAVDDPKLFAETYTANLAAQGRVNRLELENFPALYQECSTRDCAQILAAFDAGGAPVSMACLVWSPSTMYYLLSTRRHDPNDNGSVNLLLWNAMKLANQRGLLFDLDGIYTSGTARFLSGFGGRIKTRLVVRKGTTLFNALRHCRLRWTRNETHHYT
jgi:lipid II:glycine glycyltransferase (peptidoglycan interpeptide bridge formation enzyme)